MRDQGTDKAMNQKFGIGSLATMRPPPKIKRLDALTCLFHVFGLLFLPIGTAYAQASYIHSFTADPVVIRPGETSTLSWDRDYFTCNGLYLVKGGLYTLVGGQVGFQGSLAVTPPDEGINTYQMLCGSEKPTISVTVDPNFVGEAVKINTFTVSPASISVGETARLDWDVENASSCIASSAWNGDKNPAAGTEFIEPDTAGGKTYTLTCTDGTSQSVESVTLVVNEPPTAPPPTFTTSLAVSPAAITVGQSATLSWMAENATSCIASGAWSGSKSASGSEIVTSATEGNHTYALTCSGEGSDAVSSTTLTVSAKPVKSITGLVTEIRLAGSGAYEPHSDFTIGKSFSIFSALSGFGATERCFVASYPVGEQPASWRYVGVVISLNGKRISVDTASMPGNYMFELACGGTSTAAPDLENGDRKAVPVTFHSPVGIGSFATDAATVLPNGSYTLSWETGGAVSCMLDGDAVAVNGTQSFTLEDTEKTHTLTCLGSGVSDLTSLDRQTKTLTIKRRESDLTEAPSGKWFGQYTFIMSQYDSESFAMVGLADRLPGNWTNARYKVMGWNHAPAYWMWDFDALAETGTGKIYLGGSQLLALGAIRPDYRLFSPSRSQRAGQMMPDTDPPLADHIGTFTARGDGTYDVRFNLQIFLAIAGYPYVELANIMSLKVQDGGLIIRHEDGDADGRNALAFNRPVDPTVPALDGVPGVIVDGLFPARVGPIFESPVPLVRVDMDASCSGDGIPDAVKQQLGLDPCLADNDGDGISDVEELGENWALPKRTARDPLYDDFIYDVFKPTEFIGKPDFAGLIALGNLEKVVLYYNEPGIGRYQNGVNPIFHEAIPEDWFGRARPFFSYTEDGSKHLPIQHPTTGAAMNYDLGMLVFNHHSTTSSDKIRMYFANGVPDGLVLFRLAEYFGNGNYQAQYFARSANYAVIPYQQIDAHTIEFDNPRTDSKDIGTHVYMALGHTETDRVVASFDPNEPGYQAILQKARDRDEVTEPELPVQITSFVPATTSVTLGGSVQLLWQSENATSCALKQETQLLNPALAALGSYEVTPDTIGTHTYELTCAGAGDPATATTSVVVQEVSAPVDPNTITGVWTGNFSLTMRVADVGTVLGDSHNNFWTWNFDEGWAELDQGMLSVGFPFHVQDVGNASASHDHAYFTHN
ncbi:MAG TPA: hypothetical protein VNR18_13520, partial [Hyphomicrobiales bacterium]|nr:hypothetical protein [Hyphomicrobiales bacterium]